jgi:hypothetical protein
MERAQTETQNGTCRSTWLLILSQSTGVRALELNLRASSLQSRSHSNSLDNREKTAAELRKYDMIP